MGNYRTLAALVPLAAALVLAPAVASADVGKTEASPTAKGTVGGGLLGAELVLAVEAAAGVQSPWAYLGGGVLGAAGGAVGGYFLEKEASNARLPMLLLAGGLTLAIPTTVAVLSATAYEPPADYLQDAPPADEPVADPPQPGAAPTTPAAPPTPGNPNTTPATPQPSGRAPARRAPVAHAAEKLPPLHYSPPALLDMSPDLLALHIPAVEIRDTYTRTELALYGVEQSTEVHIPVLAVAF